MDKNKIYTEKEMGEMGYYLVTDMEADRDVAQSMRYALSDDRYTRGARIGQYRDEVLTYGHFAPIEGQQERKKSREEKMEEERKNHINQNYPRIEYFRGAPEHIKSLYSKLDLPMVWVMSGMSEKEAIQSVRSSGIPLQFCGGHSGQESYWVVPTTMIERAQQAIKGASQRAEKAKEQEKKGEFEKSPEGIIASGKYAVVIVRTEYTMYHRRSRDVGSYDTIHYVRDCGDLTGKNERINETEYNQKGYYASDDDARSSEHSTVTETFATFDEFVTAGIEDEGFRGNWWKMKDWSKKTEKKTTKPVHETRVVYTDASIVDGVGRWAYIIVDGEKARERTGIIEGEVTSSSQAELIACIEALRETGPDITLYTDSAYVTEGVARRWKVETYAYLWEDLRSLMGPKTHIEHIQGHKGNYYNERCDALCRT